MPDPRRMGAASPLPWGIRVLTPILLMGLALALGPTTQPHPLSAQDTRDRDFQPVRDHIHRVMEERGLPSVSVAVSVGDTIVWEEAFGWARVEEGHPATPHTPYSLASISKPMTATGVMLLVEEGLVDPDAPLDRYMGDGGLRGLAAPPTLATVRKVLAHTAGLPLHYTFFYQGEGVPPTSAQETLQRYGILVFPPGERFEYSNLGYGLLDFLIQNVSGKSYPDFMEERVFEPLGMTRSSVGITPDLEGEWALRYSPEGKPLPFYDFDHPGASAVFSSAHDLVRFGAFHLGHWIPPGSGPSGPPPPVRGGAGGAPVPPPPPPPPLLPSGTLREMHTPQEPPAGNGYGLGWFIQEEFGFRKVYHTGSMPGVSTMLALYPEEEVAIVVLLNALDREQRVEMAREVAAVVIPGYREARADQEARTRQEDLEAAPRSDAEAGERPGWPAPELTGLWEGTLTTWEGPVPVRMVVNRQGNGTLALGDGEPLPLQSPGFRDGVFMARIPGAIPTTDALRHPEQVVALKLVLRREPICENEEVTLRGQATAQTTAYPAHFALSSYLELVKRN